MTLKTIGVVCATLALLVGCASAPKQVEGAKVTLVNQEVLITEKPPSWKDRGLAFIIPVATGSAGTTVAQALIGEKRTYFTKFEELKTDNGIADAARNGAIGSIPFALWHAYRQKGDPAWVEYTVTFPDGRVGKFQVQEYDPQLYAAGDCLQLMNHPESHRVILDVMPTTGCAQADTMGVISYTSATKEKPEVNPDDLAVSVYFDFDSAHVKQQFVDVLYPVAAFIMEHTEYGVQVVGHTDRCGSIEYNIKLGLDRAQAVADVLEQQGVLSSLITVKSAGEPAEAIIGKKGCADQQQRRADVTIRFVKKVQG